MTDKKMREKALKKILSKLDDTDLPVKSVHLSVVLEGPSTLPLMVEAEKSDKKSDKKVEDAAQVEVEETDEDTE